ncbi:MAG: acyl-CoA ligase (AMP-forming), exosortase A system-associated [Gammaproteobacteria bacterium]|nr:MAG: acyl-CoA ligase (AMP-forming), exosortase A system-associated [Gammaproteobacteria bacterium]
MTQLLPRLVSEQAKLTPQATALVCKDRSVTYRQLQDSIAAVAAGLLQCGLGRGERVAVFLPKVPETVFGFFGAGLSGNVFVPVNPVLKPQQVSYILKDCQVKVLITSSVRLKPLAESLRNCPDLLAVVVVEDTVPDIDGLNVIAWPDFVGQGQDVPPCPSIDADVAAIFYTSGSTGNPKGVVLSHRNMVCGAHSVASYLHNTADDKLLAVLPFSFDYGFSQLSTAFSVGATVVLMDYLLPRDVIKAVVREGITGLAAVPPLWNQLAPLDWPEQARKTLRYITNSGGAMPRATTRRLRECLPDTQVYLMYGLTEAFRSTYLPPEELDNRPDSMGKAIPNAEVMVVRPDGSLCDDDEPGELVHRGSLVALGYWNDPVKTAERFKPTPGRESGLVLEELAVWSGDQVRRDSEGYLYFISRMDDMIKTSGYRVSPSEVEEALYELPTLAEVAAMGLSHPMLGQAIAVVATGEGLTEDMLIKHCRKQLPSYMVPQRVFIIDDMPHNQNGKIDRKLLSTRYQDLFKEPSSE